jgi:plasmid stabilization system protein ParE
MTYRVEISLAALAEIDQALEWRVEQSRPAAARWHAGLRRVIRTLRTHPRRCPLAPEAAFFGEEIRQLLYGRRGGVYRILFEVRDEEQLVNILHVVHGAREHLHPEAAEEEDEN